MKILFLVSGLGSGGAERTVTYLSEYLAKNGMDAQILSLSNNIFYKPNSDVRLNTLDIKSQPKNIIERFWLIADRFYKTRKFIKKNHFDVVFCVIPNVAEYILSLRKKQNFKLITSERNNPAIELTNDEKKLKYKIYMASDGIVFQTQRARDFYPDDIRKKGVVIHNAVGNEYVYNCPEVSERKKKITAIGRVSDQKDYPTLLRAFKIVLKKHPDYILEIFGNDSQKDTLKELLAELGIVENVIFKGVHKDAILQAMDSACYVMSSKYEGMPNALMEAMAVGLPCVSTDCPNGPAELITSGENGLLVPVGNVEALSQAILEMIENVDFANKCGANARKILETHSIEIKAKEYMDYILKILSGGNK